MHLSLRIQFTFHHHETEKETEEVHLVLEIKIWREKFSRNVTKEILTECNILMRLCLNRSFGNWLAQHGFPHKWKR